MWGAIASAAIGALGARKTAKAMQGANDLDLAKLRREAEQNGFNPLTVLRATGGQGSTKGPSGNLASGAFFQTFAQGIPSILESNYNKKMKQAQLTNINLQNKQLSEKQRDITDIPSTVNVYDPTGAMPEFRVANPELLENSANEAMSSAAMVATQYIAQHGGDYETVLATIQNINQARINNKKDPIRIKNDKIADEVINQIKKVVKQKSNLFGGLLDAKLQSFEKSIGFNRNEKILVTPILQQQKIMEELFP